MPTNCKATVISMFYRQTSLLVIARWRDETKWWAIEDPRSMQESSYCNARVGI
jgi:predicted ATPase